jgi:hypothetical protein
LILHDASLGNFALTIAASTGAFLAVAATIWIFLFDRRAHDEFEAVLRVRTASEVVYRVLEANAASKGNYLRTLPAYPDFVKVVSAMNAPYSADAIPNYLEWRERTATITAASVNEGRELEAAIVKAQKGEQVPLDPDKRRFNSAFVGPMFELDLSVQDLDWASGTRGQGVRYAGIALGLAIFLEVASLAVGLVAVTETAQGVSDDWNLLFASMLLINVGLLLFYLMRTFKVNKLSRPEWIKSRVRWKAKQLGLPPPSDD